MTERAGWPAATIIVGISTSACNACGGGCDPDEKTHATRLPGYSGERTREGCGIEFTHITTRSSSPQMRDGVRQMRPDLEFLDRPRDAD